MLPDRARSYFAFLAIIIICLIAALTVAALAPMLRQLFPASERQIVKAVQSPTTE